MMKKFFAVFFLAAALVVVGQATKAEAAEVYVGSYSDGTAVYLLTQTVTERNYSDSVRYWCTVRAGSDYLDYEFWAGASDSWTWYYRNSEGYSGRVYDGSSPVAAAICNYVRR